MNETIEININIWNLLIYTSVILLAFFLADITLQAIKSYYVRRIEEERLKDYRITYDIKNVRNIQINFKARNSNEALDYVEKSFSSTSIKNIRIEFIK